MIGHPAELTIVFFDGVCNLCNGSVQWIIRHDRKQLFYFASLQSAFAQDFFLQHPVGTQPDSVILWHQGKFSDRSSAALKIAALLGFPWNMLSVGMIMPVSWRNAVYQWIAANRYRWFGKRESCMVPSPELCARFLDAAT